MSGAHSTRSGKTFRSVSRLTRRTLADNGNEGKTRRGADQSHPEIAHVEGSGDSANTRKKIWQSFRIAVPAHTHFILTTSCVLSACLINRFVETPHRPHRPEV